MQFESANRGNVVMQIWLGKQYLNQSDHGTIALQKLPDLNDMTTQQLGSLMAAMSSEELRAIVGVIESQITQTTSGPFPRQTNLPALPAPNPRPDQVVDTTFVVRSNDK